MKHPCLFHGLALLASLIPCQAQLKINEVLSQSVPTDKFGRTGGFRDEDKHLADFIEIANTGAAEVSLEGYKLTDDRGKPAKWAFGPSVNIPAGGFLVVYASGKDRRGATLHTNFSLDRGGEYLALVGPDDKVVDSFDPLPRQYADVSFSHEGFHMKTTPGAANESPLGPPVGDVKFSISTRTFTANMSLELKVDNLPAGAKIGYTINGTVPDPTLTTPPTWYEGPITLDKTVQIRARTFMDGRLPGEIRTEAFVKVLDTVASWNSNLPVLVIDNFGKRRPPATNYVPAQLMVLEPKTTVDGSKRTSILQEPDLTTRNAIRTRGSSTNGNAKMNLAMEIWYDDMDFDDKRIPLVGMPADSDWVLHGPFDFDKALIRNSVASEFGRQLGGWHPRSRFVEVFINIDGDDLEPTDYYGVYELLERIKQGEERVNIQDSNGAVNGGYMLKVDRTSVAGQDPTISGGGESFVWVEPNAEAVTPAQKTWLQKFLNDAGNAMKAANAEDPEQGYRKWIDSRSWIDEWAIRTLTKDPDGFRLSTYLYMPRNGKLHYGPLWDFDRTMGCDSDDRAKLVKGMANIEYFATQGMWKNLLGSGTNTGKKAIRPDFHQELIDRWQELRLHQLSVANMHAVVDGYAAQVREAQVRNFARWTGQKPPGNNRDYNAGNLTWEGEITHLKTWLKLRAEWMDTPAQYIPQPTAEKVGIVEKGAVVMNPVTGSQVEEKIYYTIDGSDPRAVGAVPSSTALKLETPLAVDKNTQITFRRQRGEFWSGPLRVGYVVDGIPATKENLLVTEIMYHPTPGTEAEQSIGFHHENSFEFLELANVGDKDMYVGDVSVGGAIQFWFDICGKQILAPGERVVLVSDIAAFEKRYGKGLPVAREFVGNLSNAGERIVVKRGEAVLHDFRYGDRSPWPETADKLGLSLALREPKPGTDLASPGNWTTDTAVGGTPGKAGGVPPIVYVNEVLANSGTEAADAIELFNPGNSEVDISGWYLTDDEAVPAKYIIPSGTKIAAGAYLILREDNDNDPNNNANLGPDYFGKAFGLNSNGDTIYLYSVSDGKITGFRDGFRFGNSAVGGTFGRYLGSDGLPRHPLQESATLGKANSAPFLGPVVISEVMYHPLEATAAAEYVEIVNRSSAPVSLFDAAKPNNTWRLNGADFTFPKGVTLAAGELAIVSNKTPEEFRKAAGLSPNVQVFGPFAGRLDNGGEAIELQQPLPPVADGTFVYMTVDELNYRDSDPWPKAADGSGAALERIDLNAYGDQATNWRAGVAGGSAGRIAKPGEDIAAWKAKFFSAEEATQDSVSGLNADPDRDGQRNLLEYALGGNPKAFDPRPLVEVALVTVDGKNYAAVSFMRRKNSEAEIEVERSTNLASWSGFDDAVGTVQEQADGLEKVTLRERTVLSGLRHYRLRVLTR